MLLSLTLLRREMRLRLEFAPQPLAEVPQPAT